jgi:hypothetical protein
MHRVLWEGNTSIFITNLCIGLLQIRVFALKLRLVIYEILLKKPLFFHEIISIYLFLQIITMVPATLN